MDTASLWSSHKRTRKSVVALFAWIIIFTALMSNARASELSTSFDGGPEFGTVSITLFDTPCEHEDVLKLIPESYHGLFQSATASHSKGDVTANACWSTQISPFGPVAPGRLFIIDATGEFGFLSVEQFNPDKKEPAKPNSF
jgi:hypothetical protein